MSDMPKVGDVFKSVNLDYEIEIVTVNDTHIFYSFGDDPLHRSHPITIARWMSDHDGLVKVEAMR